MQQQHTCICLLLLLYVCLDWAGAEPIDGHQATANSSVDTSAVKPSLIQKMQGGSYSDWKGEPQADAYTTTPRAAWGVLVAADACGARCMTHHSLGMLAALIIQQICAHFTVHATHVAAVAVADLLLILFRAAPT